MRLPKRHRPGHYDLLFLLSRRCRRWKQNGTYEYTDQQNGRTVQIPYAVVTDCQNYNAYTIVPQIRAKTLLIGVQKDIIIDTKNLQQLAKSIPDGKSVFISESGHNFTQKQNQADLYQKLANCLIFKSFELVDIIFNHFARLF